MPVRQRFTVKLFSGVKAQNKGAHVRTPFQLVFAFSWSWVFAEA